MRQSNFVTAAIVALVFSAPLRAQLPSPAQAVAPLPSITLAPELDRVLRDYEKAWGAGDAAALSVLFAEDGFLLQGGRAPVRGRSAIKTAYTGRAGGALRLRALAAATSDTVGYIIGAYGYSTTPTAQTDVGKFTLTLKRAKDGRWLIFSDMDNASAPPPQRPGNQ